MAVARKVPRGYASVGLRHRWLKTLIEIRPLVPEEREPGSRLSRSPGRTTTIYFRRHSPGRSLPRPSIMITHSHPSGHALFIDGSHAIWQVDPASRCAKLVPAAHVSPFPQSAVKVHGVPIRSSD